TDLGVVTTTRTTGPALTRTMLSELASGKPDVVVFELGDGILGGYGVDAILECPDIRTALSAVILSANDPVAAWGGVKLLRERFLIEPCVVTGPATDNQVGVDSITTQMGVPACNASEYGARLRRVLGRPARRLRRAHRRAAQDGGARRNTAAHSRHLGGFPLCNAAGLRRGLPAAARGSRAPGAIQLCTARAPARAADRARRPSRLLRHRDPARERAAARRAPGGTDAVCERRHRQHRLGAQTRGRHAPSAAARGPVQLR